VRDVCAIETFALLDEGLLPDHLLARAELDGDVKHGVVCCVLEPFVVNWREAFA